MSEEKRDRVVEILGELYDVRMTRAELFQLVPADWRGADLDNALHVLKKRGTVTMSKNGYQLRTAPQSYVKKLMAERNAAGEQAPAAVPVSVIEEKPLLQKSDKIVERVDCEGVGDNDGFFEIRNDTNPTPLTVKATVTEIDDKRNCETCGCVIPSTFAKCPNALCDTNTVKPAEIPKPTQCRICESYCATNDDDVCQSCHEAVNGRDLTAGDVCGHTVADAGESDTFDSQEIKQALMELDERLHSEPVTHVIEDLELKLDLLSDLERILDPRLERVLAAIGKDLMRIGGE